MYIKTTYFNVLISKTLLYSSIRSAVGRLHYNISLAKPDYKFKDTRTIFILISVFNKHI